MSNINQNSRLFDDGDATTYAGMDFNQGFKNLKSNLGDFADEVKAIGSFITQDTPAEKAAFIENNYQTFTLDQLNEAVDQMNSGILQYNYRKDDILRNLQARIANLTSSEIVPGAKTSTNASGNSSPDSIVSPTNASTASDFAPIITDSTQYDLSTDKQKKKYEEASNTPDVDEQAFSEFMSGKFKGNQGTRDARTELELKTSFNQLRNDEAERSFDFLKSQEGKMTDEEKRNRVATLTEELKESIGYDEKLDKNMLLFKFGVDLLNARSNKTKPLPKFLDAVAQALAPTSQYIMQQKAQKQNDLKEIGLTAFSLVKEEDDAAQRRFEEDPRFASAVMAIDYDDAGNRSGQTSFFKPIMTPAEATFYSNFKYPETIGGQPVPKELVGKQMFTITQTPGATDQIYTSGLVGKDLKAASKHFETLRFLKQGLENTQLVLGIGNKYAQQGKSVYGPSYNVRIFSKTLSEILDESSNTFAEFFGQGDKAKAIKEKIAGKSNLDQQQIILKELGVDMDYNQLVSVANDQKNAIIDEIYQSGLSNEEKEAEAAKVAQYYGQFQQDLRGDPDLDIIKILETTQTFAFARYLQGSNRLLKDVIAQANSIVRLGGFTNSNEKTMNRYKQFLDYFAREYNEELQFVLNAEEYEQHKIRISSDGLSFEGGWNPLTTDTGSPNSSAQTSNYFTNQKIDKLDGLVDPELLEQLRN
jgi:hypothetical protein